MTEHTAEISTDLPCHRCGYDLRAHPHDGVCPECGASVAEAWRVAAVPRRPAWRDSDPRWRRRMLAGAWVLVLLPLMDALRASEWASNVRVPATLEFPNSYRTLDDTLLWWSGVYQPLLFCIGVVLLFARERGRQRGRLDWTRRWGVGCTYVVFVLSTLQVLFIVALVVAGISALFLTLPPRYEPPATHWLASVSTAYLRHGPYGKESAIAVLVGFSSITVMLACVPLFTALRSSGPKRLAAALVAPLAFFSVIHLAQAAQYCLALSGMGMPPDIAPNAWYFRPQILVEYAAALPDSLTVLGPNFSAFAVEATKWCVFVAIAVWASIAQVAAWRRSKTPSGVRTRPAAQRAKQGLD